MSAVSVTSSLPPLVLPSSRSASSSPLTSSSAASLPFSSPASLPQLRPEIVRRPAPAASPHTLPPVSPHSLPPAAAPSPHSHTDPAGPLSPSSSNASTYRPLGNPLINPLLDPNPYSLPLPIPLQSALSTGILPSTAAQSSNLSQSPSAASFASSSGLLNSSSRSSLAPSHSRYLDSSPSTHRLRSDQSKKSLDPSLPLSARIHSTYLSNPAHRAKKYVYPHEEVDNSLSTPKLLLSLQSAAASFNRVMHSHEPELMNIPIEQLEKWIFTKQIDLELENAKKSREERIKEERNSDSEIQYSQPIQPGRLPAIAKPHSTLSNTPAYHQANLHSTSQASISHSDSRSSIRSAARPPRPHPVKPHRSPLGPIRTNPGPLYL